MHVYLIIIVYACISLEDQDYGPEVILFETKKKHIVVQIGLCHGEHCNGFILIINYINGIIVKPTSVIFICILYFPNLIVTTIISSDMQDVTHAIPRNTID